MWVKLTHIFWGIDHLLPKECDDDIPPPKLK